MEPANLALVSLLRTPELANLCQRVGTAGAVDPPISPSRGGGAASAIMSDCSAGSTLWLLLCHLFCRRTVHAALLLRHRIDHGDIAADKAYDLVLPALPSDLQLVHT